MFPKSVKKHAPKTLTLEVINHWYARADIPAMLTKFIKPDSFHGKICSLAQ